MIAPQNVSTVDTMKKFNVGSYNVANVIVVNLMRDHKISPLLQEASFMTGS